MTTIYNNVKTLAETKGMSIAEIERISGVANGTIGKWQKGQKPALDTVLKICTALDVELTAIVPPPYKS